MHVTLADFHIGQPAQALAGSGDHARAGIDADVALGVGGDQFGQHASPEAMSSTSPVSSNGKAGARQRLPGTARRVVALHVAGHAVAQFWSEARLASTAATRSASWRSNGSSLPLLKACHNARCAGSSWASSKR